MDIGNWPGQEDSYHVGELGAAHRKEKFTINRRTQDRFFTISYTWNGQYFLFETGGEKNDNGETLERNFKAFLKTAPKGIAPYKGTYNPNVVKPIRSFNYIFE